jgi:hypothetical protein
MGSEFGMKDVIVHSDNRCEIYLESAWYPPSDMILEIYKQIAEIDDEIKVSGKYWDEGHQSNRSI